MHVPWWIIHRNVQKKSHQFATNTICYIQKHTPDKCHTPLVISHRSSFRFVLLKILLQQTFQDKLFHIPIRPLLVTSNIPTFILNINNGELFLERLWRLRTFWGLKFTIASAPQIKYNLPIEVPSLTGSRDWIQIFWQKWLLYEPLLVY